MTENLSYDELPCYKAKKEDINLKLAKKLFASIPKKFSIHTARSLDILTKHQGKELPSLGGILLFGNKEKRLEIFPNSIIRCARFKGTSKANILDYMDIEKPLTLAVNDILDFIKKHIMVGLKIEDLRHEQVHQYPPIVVREAVINAIVHADYSFKGSHIQIAIFDDRIEIINPGALPFGLSLESAMAGLSQLRNKVIGRVFRELKYTEQRGSGIIRTIETCKKQNIPTPKFEEISNFFKVTLHSSY